jgi:hypothetical protein
MKQMTVRLLAEMKATQQKMETNHERKKAKMDAGQEEIKVQVGSLASGSMPARKR